MELTGPGNSVEIKQNLLNSKIKTITAYYGSELIEWGQEVERNHKKSSSTQDFDVDSEPKLSTFNETNTSLDTPDYLADIDCVESFG